MCGQGVLGQCRLKPVPCRRVQGSPREGPRAASGQQEAWEGPVRWLLVAAGLYISVPAQ